MLPSLGHNPADKIAIPKANAVALVTRWR
jgi:hypothetical protein